MYSKVKEKIVSSVKSFVLKGKQGVGKTNLLFDCFLEKICAGGKEKIFFLTSTSAHSFFLKEKAALDEKFRSGYTNLNIVTLNDFIKNFIREYLIFSKYKFFSLPVEQYCGSRLLFILDLLGQITLPDRYENLKNKYKLAANTAEIFSFLNDLSIRPDFLKRIKGYEWIFEVYNLYKTKSIENGFYFNDIFSTLAVDILRSLPDNCFIEDYAFYIDDLQELTPAHYTFLKNFTAVLNRKNCKSRFVVTYEPDYCLNSSKGASADIIKNFIDDFSIEKNNIIELNNNLYLNETIYKLRESLINYTDESQSNAGLFVQPEPDGSVICVKTSTYIDQTYYIAAKIKQFINDDVMPSEIGIFVNKFDKNTIFLKTVLENHSIPAEFEFGDFIENSIIYRFFQFFLNLIENTDCDDAVCLLLDSPVFGLDSRTVGDIRKCAKRSGKSLFAAAVRYSDKITDLKKRKIVCDTLFFISNVKLKDQNVNGIFYKFAEISGLFDYSLKNEYTELNVLRRIFRAVDFFVSFYRQLKEDKAPDLKDVIDNQEYFMHKTVRNTNLEQLDSVKIVSLRSKVPAKFKVVFVPDMNANLFPNILYEKIPCLLNDISGKIPNLKQLPFISDKNYLLNAVGSAESNILFLYAKESGEPSALYDYIMNLPYACCEQINSGFAEFDNPFFIRDSSASAIWALRKLADDITPEHKKVIKKNINLFIPSLDLTQDTVSLELPLSVSLKDDHIFSATDIDTYLECPRKFFFKRLMKIQDDTLSENASFGQLVHSVLELFHSLYPDWKRGLSSDEISNRKEILFNLLDRQIKIFGDFPDFMRLILVFQAKNCLMNYFDALMEERIKIYYLEKKVNFFLDNVPFTAKIDRIDDGASNGGYRIIDYKTGGSKTPKSAGLKNEFVFEKLNTTKKSFQLPIYYFAAKEIVRLNIRELSKFFLQAKDKKTKRVYCLKSVLPIEAESKPKQVTLEELNNVKDKIIGYTNEIKNGVYEKKKNSNCFECPCKFICG